MLKNSNDTPQIIDDAKNITPLTENSLAELAELLKLLQTKNGFTFDQYKTSTTNRCIERRISINKLDSLVDYISLVKQSDTEADALLKELQISVTEFFRDENVFGAIAEAINNILSSKKHGEQLRVWVPGCATGEEAISIAMIIAEVLGDRVASTPVKIFATDLDAKAVSIARKSIYSKPMLNDVHEQLFNKYVEANDDSNYRVQTHVRNMVVFAEHDLLNDPPFTRLDLVSCRNILIYFKRETQERLLRQFHSILNPGGFLVLGTAESVGTNSDYFETLYTVEKIYTTKDVKRTPLEFSDSSHLQRHPARPITTTAHRTVEQQIQEALLEHYAPPSILVNSDLDIVHLIGELAPFMVLPNGNITVNAIKLVISPLRLELRLLLQKVQRENSIERTRAIQCDGSTGRMSVTMVAVPINIEAGAKQNTLVLFESGQPIEYVPEEAQTDEEIRIRIRDMEEQLIATRELLETSVHEVEVTSEELQAINVEFQSASEEYQTTNEELQSTNEEFLTVNNELTIKTAELIDSKVDLESILNAVVEAIIVLDDNMFVTHYSSGTKDVFKLMPNSFDQPVVRIGDAIDLTLFWNEIKTAVQSKQIVSKELVFNEIAYLVRMVPIAKGGLIISFIDETERLKAGLDERRLAAVVRDSNDAITVQNLDGYFIAWNRGAENLYGYDEIEALTMNIRDIVPTGHEASAIAYLEQLIAGEAPESVEVIRRTKSDEELHVWITATALCDDNGQIYAIATTERDLTERLADAVRQAKLDAISQDISERVERLTPREREVMKLLVAGIASASSRQIAEQLGISVRTVETHRRRIKDKMNAQSMSDLVDKAKMSGMYLPTPDLPSSNRS